MTTPTGRVTTDREALRRIDDAIARLRYITDHNADKPAAEAARWAITDLDLARAALSEAAPPSGLDSTETRCSLEGVHEHAFRGPHRFREWEPGT